MWPRLRLGGSGIDLSQYTHVVVEIENPTDQAESLAVAVDAPVTARRVTSSVNLPPHGTQKIDLDISAGASLDQSNVTKINLYRSRPHNSSTYILKKIIAVQNPDYISARNALGKQLSQAQQAATRFQRDAHLIDDNISKFNDSKDLIDAAQADFRQQKIGYITSVQAKLETSQQNLAQLGMILRKTNSLIWTSPLGLAIRNNTLPEPSDAALTQINERVSLDEYQPICVNISAAAQAQTITVRLDAKSAPAGFITLRPTLFAKARDGSETADAIGEETSEIELQVEAFQTKQFIVWVNTKNTSIKPDNYAATLRLTSSDANIPKLIPINVKVAALHLATSLPINVLNWAYFYQGFARVTEGLEKEAVANLRDYGVNTWIIFYDQLPLPLIDKKGKYAGLNLTERNRGKRFEQTLDLLKGNPNETFIFLLGFQRPEVRELFSRPGVLAGYLKDLHALMDKHQISPDKRYLQFWDEPQVDQVQESVEWIKEVRALDPTFKIFSDTSYTPANPTLAHEFSESVNFWMPNWDSTSGKESGWANAEALKIPHFGFYRCLTSRNIRGVNIYEYYRLMSWRLMQNGYDSVGFWTYNSGLKVGANEWDGTTGSNSAGLVVYNKNGKLLTSRRWELFREGMEDYKLAQAAFGENGVLDANKNPALMTFCREITEHPENLGQAGSVREKLMNLALQRVAR